MKNEFKLKNAIIYTICAIIGISIILAITNYYQHKKYRENFNQTIGQLVTKITEKYPNIEKNEIIEILNSQEKIDKSIFTIYGIDYEKESLILKNDEQFLKFLITNMLILLTLSLIITAIFLKYNYLKIKNIENITKYIEEINNRNYNLKIDENTEGELSILKNEIYKTTVMLNEIAENSQNDKIKLKDSLSDISHQLKTPLTSITIMLDNILDNSEMDINTRSEFLKDIKREVINISFLVNALLKLSKLDANSVKFINKEEDAKDILNEAIKNVEVLCDLKNVLIHVEEKTPSRIYCDLKWQVEAITNILKNAIEHSNENTEIKVYYEQNNIYTKIEIRDFGIGINKKDLPHIFERFYKGENSSNDSIGIGLALAKSIIENNNGYIDVESESGKGTLFTIKYFNKI